MSELAKLLFPRPDWRNEWGALKDGSPTSMKRPWPGQQPPVERLLRSYFISNRRYLAHSIPSKLDNRWPRPVSKCQFHHAIISARFGPTAIMRIVVAVAAAAEVRGVAWSGRWCGPWWGGGGLQHRLEA